MIMIAVRFEWYTQADSSFKQRIKTERKCIIVADVMKIIIRSKSCLLLDTLFLKATNSYRSSSIFLITHYLIKS